MNTPPQNPNGSESKLVVIIDTPNSGFQATKIFDALRTRFPVEMLRCSGGKPPDFYRREASDYLDEIRTLVAGVGFPARELVGIAPNLATVITTNPIYRDTSHFNGSVDVVFISYDDVSHNNTTTGILKYLIPDYSEKPADKSKPRNSK